MELADLRTDARYLINPQLNATDYPNADLDRNLNRWYRTIMAWIIPEQGDWELEGDIIYRDVQVGVTDYEIPQNLIRVYKGEIMYETGGDFVPLDFISVQRYQDRAEGNSTRTIDAVEKPTCELFGNYAQIRPAGDEAVTNGIKLWVQLDLVDLDDNNDVPNLLEPVVRALSIGAALDYAIAEEMKEKEVSLKRLLFGDTRVRGDEGVKGDVLALYANRSGARRDRLSASRRTSYK